MAILVNVTSSLQTIGMMGQVEAEWYYREIHCICFNSFWSGTQNVQLRESLIMIYQEGECKGKKVNRKDGISVAGK